MSAEFSGNAEHQRWFGIVPLFNPKEGTTILEPPGKGKGFWVGAPSVLYEADKFYLYYRLRNPRKPGDPKERGFECRIAASTDGVHFTDVWCAGKTDFDAHSIERAALVKTLERKYRLYISFQDHTKNVWQIDLMEADSPKGFEPVKRSKVLNPQELGVRGVKDPVVIIVGRMYYMLLDYAPMDKRTENTGLATSGNGIHFQWHGDILSPGKGWDAQSSRPTSVVYIPPLFNMFYDGAAIPEEVCEEKAGLAISFDLRTYERVTDDSPILASPHSSGSLRYIETLKVGTAIYYYYEYARPDGSHELRMNKVVVDQE